jgi:RNA polymerase sigma factor (sigma-70 family)
MELPDNTCIEWFNKPEEGSYCKIFKLYHRDADKYAQFFLNYEDVNEQVSEAFFILFKGIQHGKKYRNLSHVKATLLTILRNLLINYIKYSQRQSRYRKEFIRTNGHTKSEPASGETAENIESELIRIIHLGIEKLPAACKTIFKMLYIQELSIKKVALELRLSPQTIRNQKSRAIFLLRDYILRHEGEIKEEIKTWMK